MKKYVLLLALLLLCGASNGFAQYPTRTPSSGCAVEESKIMVDDATNVWLFAPRPLPSFGKITLDAIWLSSINTATIKIKLYDILGVEVQDITDSFSPTSGIMGILEMGIVEFDGSKLPSGIYFVEINGGGYRNAVPVIIAR